MMDTVSRFSAYKTNEFDNCAYDGYLGTNLARISIKTISSDVYSKFYLTYELIFKLLRVYKS